MQNKNRIHIQGNFSAKWLCVKNKTSIYWNAQQIARRRVHGSGRRICTSLKSSVCTLRFSSLYTHFSRVVLWLTLKKKKEKKSKEHFWEVTLAEDLFFLWVNKCPASKKKRKKTALSICKLWLWSGNLINKIRCRCSCNA